MKLILIIKGKLKVKMKLLGVFLVVLFVGVFMDQAEANKKKLQIGVKKKVENCDRRSKKGDTLHMHYTVSVFNLRSIMFWFMLCKGFDNR